MRKSDAVRFAGSEYRLAKILGISPQAVNQWPDDRIPELQRYRLKEIKPRWFAQHRREQAAAASAQTEA